MHTAKRNYPAAILTLTLAFGVPVGAWAQIRLQPGRLPNAFETQPSAEPNAGVFPPAERKMVMCLTKGQELLAKQRYGDAIPYLRAILDGPEDHFYRPDKDAPIHRSLKSEARLQVGRMPPSGLETYQRLYGTDAQRLLEQAVADGGVAGLAAVSRRYFHTEAGYEATFLLGLNHFNHGRPLAAAWNLGSM